MSLADKIDQNEKLNIVIGDYFIKSMGLPSRTVLSNLLFMDFPAEKKERISDRSSFFQVAQAFLDFGLRGRGSLIKKISQYYRCGSNKMINYQKFLFSKQVETMISFDYDTILEDFYSDYIYKVPFEKIDFEKMTSDKREISLYKCFGDVSNESEMMITNQDFRKFTVLSYFKPYIETLADEFSTKKTLLLGCDLDNSDFIQYMTFILTLSEKKGLQPIYFIGNDKPESENAVAFLERFNIEILEDSIEMFKEKKNHSQEKINKDDSQRKIFAENSDKNISEDKEEATDEKTVPQTVESEPENDLEDEGIALEDMVELPLEEITEIVETLKNEEKTVVLDGSKNEFFFVETAPELKFTSLHLYKNPIRFNNIPEALTEQIVAKIETPSIKIGDEQIFGTKLKLSSSGLMKFLEIRTREFRIKFSVRISSDGKITEDKDYLEYELFTSINPNRIKNVVEFFIGIFSGVTISFSTPKYNAEVQLHNRLQMLKFQIIRESEINYQVVSDSLPLAEDKKFYSSSLTYYLNYLLWNSLRESKIESWGNITVDSEISLNNCNQLIILREHELLLKNGRKIVAEKITVDDVKDSFEVKGAKQLLTQKRLTIETEIRDC